MLDSDALIRQFLHPFGKIDCQSSGI